MQSKNSVKGTSRSSFGGKNKHMWVWWCLVVVVLIGTVGGILFARLNLERQRQDSVDNIQRMYNELNVVVTHLNQEWPDNPWIDKSKCYTTDDKGFGYESAHLCEARFEMIHNDFSPEQAEVYAAASSTSLRSMPVVNELQGGGSYAEFDKQIYSFGFVLRGVKMSQGMCGLVYSYTQKERALSGQIYCANEVDEDVHKRFGDDLG